MVQYTTLNKEEVATIISNFLPTKVLSYKVLSGGSENTNYVVRTENGNFVLTICEQKTEAKATEIAYLLEHLAEHGFATSKIVRNTNHVPVSLWNGKPVLLKEYIEGIIIEDMPQHLLQYLGQELGKLHQIEAPDYLPQSINYGMDYFHETEDYTPNSPFHHWLKEMHQYIMDQMPAQLPKALIHSDVFYNNVIVSNDRQRATIMDFEEVSYYYRVFDLGMMMVGMCSADGKVDLAKAKHILKGYQKEIQLQEIELKAIKISYIYAATATAFWRHQHFNHVKPDPVFKDRYLEMKILADYVRVLPDDCFIGRGGER